MAQFKSLLTTYYLRTILPIPTAELSKTNSRYLISKRQAAKGRVGGERHETIFDTGDKQNS